jgi:hypothetical protein
MDRRAFISSVTLARLAAPLAAEGQQTGKVSRIGLVSPSSASVGNPLISRTTSRTEQLSVLP